MAGTYSVEAPVTAVHTNVDQQVIVITEDRLRLMLRDHLEVAERRREWIAPVSSLFAVVTAIVTAEFKDALGLSAASWRAVFVIAGIASALWLVVWAKNYAKGPSLEDLFKKVKNSSGDMA